MKQFLHYIRKFVLTLLQICRTKYRMMTDEKYDNNLKDCANKLLCRFEVERFQNSGRYSYQMNLVLAFDEYVRQMNDWDLQDYLETDDTEVVRKFRHMIDCGVDEWLSVFDVKTLALM